MSPGSTSATVCTSALSLPSRVSHSCCLSLVALRAILPTPAKEKPLKGPSIFRSHQGATDHHNGRCTLSCHMSSLIQLLAVLSSCLKLWACATSTWAPTVTTVGDEAVPPHKQCDLGHWIPHRHVIEESLCLRKPHPLRLRAVSEGHAVLSRSLRLWSGSTELQPSYASLLRLPCAGSFPKGLSVHRALGFYRCAPVPPGSETFSGFLLTIIALNILGILIQSSYLHL